MAKKPRGYSKYVLPVALGGAALLILADVVGVFASPIDGGTPSAPSGTITITVESAMVH